jgi:chorismate synthase
MLRFLTAGESHGPALVTIVEGLPSGVPVDLALINRDLARRQAGYGRGGRMRIEKDEVRVLSGLRHGLTLGGPIALLVENRDWVNWNETMAAEPLSEGYTQSRQSNKALTRPRPGHADLVGGLKYEHDDLRNVLERASARETTMRVAGGSLARQLLAPFGIRAVGHVLTIGPVEAQTEGLGFDEIASRAEASEVRCADAAASRRMIEEIDAAKADGDSLGGIVEVIVEGVPPGLGSYVHFDRKLDGALGQALLSVQAAKGVEVGTAFENARRRGSAVHDEIGWEQERGWFRFSNRAGGLEAGMTNGMPLVVRVAFKPISTLYKPLRSADFHTKEPALAQIERSDACAIPAAAVIAECVAAFVVAQHFLAKFGGDSLPEVKRNYEGYMQRVRER